MSEGNSLFMTASLDPELAEKLVVKGVLLRSVSSGGLLQTGSLWGLLATS